MLPRAAGSQGENGTRPSGMFGVSAS